MALCTPHQWIRSKNNTPAIKTVFPLQLGANKPIELFSEMHQRKKIKQLLTNLGEVENSRTVLRNSLRWILEYYLEQSYGILDLMLCKPTAQQSIQQQARISSSKQQRRKPAAQNRTEQSSQQRKKARAAQFVFTARHSFPLIESTQ